MDRGRRDFLKGVVAGTAAVGVSSLNLPVAEAALPEAALPPLLEAESSSKRDYPMDYDKNYVKSTVNFYFKDHIYIDVYKPLRLFHLHRYISDQRRENSIARQYERPLIPIFHGMYEFNRKLSVSRRTYKNLRNGGLTHNEKSFMCLKGVGVLCQRLFINGKPWIIDQLIPIDPIPLIEIKKYKGAKAETFDLANLTGVDLTNLKPERYIIPVN